MRVSVGTPAAPAAGRVRVLWPDHLGLARGKYLPTRSNRTSTNHCVGVFSQHFDRRTSFAPGAGFDAGFPDLEARFDASAVRPGWEPSTSVVVADLFRDDEPLAVSPRLALRRAIGGWADLGYSVDVGIELEAFVLEPDGGGGWRAWATPGGFVYGTGALADPAGLFDEIMESAQHCELGIESVTCESDVPQFEIALDHGDALDAVDRTFLVRLMAREIAHRRGLLLTFMGRPFADKPGSGMHVNVSLHDRDRRNALAGDGADDGLSDLCRSFVAGLVGHHVGMTALCAPTVNAYKRLRPGMLSGYWANWGLDHRVATTRIPPHRGAATHVEHRMSDGAANPYLAVAAILHAGRLGVVAGSVPPPAESTLEPDAAGVHCPSDLAAALDALEADHQLVDAIGPDVVANFTAIKRVEWQRFTDAVTDWELANYLWFC
jgi:glutamine synthetase